MSYQIGTLEGLKWAVGECLQSSKCRQRGLGLDFTGSLGSFGMVRAGEKGDSVSLVHTINRAQGKKVRRTQNVSYRQHKSCSLIGRVTQEQMKTVSPRLPLTPGTRVSY